MIGLGEYTREAKVFDQTRKGTLARLVPRGFFGRVLWPPADSDGGLRGAMNVRLVTDGSMLVAWPIVPGEREPWPTRWQVDDATRVTGRIAKVLTLVDQEAVL